MWYVSQSDGAYPRRERRGIAPVKPITANMAPDRRVNDGSSTFDFDRLRNGLIVVISLLLAVILVSFLF
ncbi:MAG: hypothetical protein ACI9PP_000049 [Halobacteriales archaeon]|jgi:hypothetical protein